VEKPVSPFVVGDKIRGIVDRRFSRLQLLILRNSRRVILDHSAERPRRHSVALLLSTIQPVAGRKLPDAP